MTEKHFLGNEAKSRRDRNQNYSLSNIVLSTVYIHLINLVAKIQHKL